MSVKPVLGLDPFEDLVSQAWLLPDSLVTQLTALLDRAAPLLPARLSPSWCRYQVMRAVAAAKAGDPTQAQTTLDHVLRETIGASPLCQAIAQTGVGNVRWFQGEFERSRVAGERALALYQAAQHLKGVRRQRMRVAVCLAQLGLFERARDTLHRAAAESLLAGDTSGAATVWTNIANFEIREGNFVDAALAARRGLAMHVDANNPTGAASAKSKLAHIAMRQGDPAQAMSLWLDCLQEQGDSGDERLAIERQVNVIQAQIAMEQGQQALVRAEHLMASVQDYHHPGARGRASLVHGIALASIGRHEQAEQSALKAVEQFTEAREQLLANEALYFSAESAFEVPDDRWRGVQTTLLRALQGPLEASVERRALVLQARWTQRNGDPHAALQLLDTAERLATSTLARNVKLARADILVDIGRGAEAAGILKRLRTDERAEQSSRQKERFSTLNAMHELDRVRHEAEMDQLRNVDLADANASLKRLASERNLALSTIAHDLRNPLGGVTLLLDLLREQLTDSGSVDNSTLGLISDCSKRVSDVIEHLQGTLDQVERVSEHAPATMVDVALMMWQATRHFARQAQAKGVQIHLVSTPSGPVMADPRCVQICLSNLISNAIKFTPPNSEVRVGVQRVTRSDGPKLCAWIQDQGPGFTDDDRALLYSRFQRLSARPTANETSTGLGLHLVKRHADSMGASIELHSAPGSGARFELLFDLRPVPEAWGDALG